jgi:hypothetical protein
MAGIPRMLIERLGEDVYYRSIGKPGPSPSTLQRRAKKEALQEEAEPVDIRLFPKKRFDGTPFCMREKLRHQADR